MEGGTHAAARDPVSDNSVNCFHFVTRFFLKAMRPFKPHRVSNADIKGGERWRQTAAAASSARGDISEV